MTTSPHYIRWMVANRPGVSAADYAHLWAADGRRPGQLFPGSQQRCVLPPPRTCIVCGAQVPAGKSEACPHE